MLIVLKLLKEVKVFIVDLLKIEENNLEDVIDNFLDLVDDDFMDKDDYEVFVLELLDEVFGEEEDDEDEEDDIDIFIMFRRRGRKKRVFGVLKIIRILKRELMVCFYCEEIFIKEVLFVIYVFEYIGVKLYICEVFECVKGFMFKFKLERYRFIYICFRFYKCLYCDKLFNRKDYLKNYMVIYDLNKKCWVCEECGKEYCYNFLYRIYKVFYDADVGRIIECGICYKYYDLKDELLYYLKVYSGVRFVKNCIEKIYACEDCGKIFYIRKDVRRYMIIYIKKKDFLC